MNEIEPDPDTLSSATLGSATLSSATLGSDAAALPPPPNRFRRVAFKVARIVVFGYFTVLATLVFMETRLVYPGAFLTAGEVELHPEIETVVYTSSDGVQIESRLYHRDSNKPIVLYLHGNGEKAVWLDRWLIRLSEHFDANVMAAEFRGYGNDQPGPTEQGVLKDCYAAREFLTDRYGVSADEIILYGRSLGGGCAVALAADGGAKALVLERTFDRLVDVAAKKYPLIPVQWLMRNRFDSIDRIQAYDGPLVQIHGTSDTLIPIEHAERLFQSARSVRKQWLPVAGLGHNDWLSADQLAKLASCVNASL